MTTTVTDITSTPPLSHTEAMDLQAAELGRTLELLRALDASDWEAQTDCPDWDVRRMYLHVLGACDAAASTRENVHQMLAGRRHQKDHGGAVGGRPLGGAGPGTTGPLP